jgi:hypothetical protein
LGESHWREVIEEIKALNLQADFNQGLDARLINEDVGKALNGIDMPVIRIAYDFPKMGKAVKRAIDVLGHAGFSRSKVVSYVLFNFEDTPEELFERVRNLLSWGATAYPMRFQPLNTLEKDSYISPGWSHEELDLVAQARRVIGFGGAFPPYEGLTRKFIDARNFEEAFSLWPKTEKQTSITRPRANFHITETEIQRAQISGPAALRELSLGNPDALAGKHILLVTAGGRMKKVSLLNILNRAPKRSGLGLTDGDKLVAALDIQKSDLVCLASKKGRVGLFKGDTIRSRSLVGHFAKRFLLGEEEDDAVVSACVTKIGETLVAMTDIGIFTFKAVEQLYLYDGAGVGELILPSGSGTVVSAASSAQDLKVSLASSKSRIIEIRLSPLGLHSAIPTIDLRPEEKIVSAKFEAEDAHAVSIVQMGRDHQWPNLTDAETFIM